jgi:hypothetical protein
MSFAQNSTSVADSSQEEYFHNFKCAQEQLEYATMSLKDAEIHMKKYQYYLEQCNKCFKE